VNKKYIVCCDWGTSSLRIRLVSLENSVVVGKVTSDLGVGTLHSLWSKSKGDELLKGNDRNSFYLSYLKRELDKLSINIGKSDLIISGMASSNIGLKELSYADLPFSLDGEDSVVSYIPASNDFNHPILLISGVKGQGEVMRGEEVQAIGIANIAPGIVDDGNIILLPGTHSKHLYLEDMKISKIETYITGEMFALLSQNGLLKDSLEKPYFPLEEKGWRIFLEGVDCSGEITLLQSLFKIRTNHLLDKFTMQENSLFLSGLLIGYELRSLLTKKYNRIILCSGDKLFEYYKRAITFLGLHDSTDYISPEILELSTVEGQLVIAKKYLNDQACEKIELN
jgi:2-dehydro-3-deoxygalactonokinase